MKIFAIDPGNIKSGYVVLNEDLSLKEFGKIDNEELLSNIYNGDFDKCSHVAVEMIASYGMSVGQSIFETCVWIGRFQEAILHRALGPVNYVYRKDEKINLCGTMKAKDTNIRQALIDRFGVVGVIKNKGWFYGVSNDVWSAIAVGVTYYDMYMDSK